MLSGLRGLERELQILAAGHVNVPQAQRSVQRVLRRQAASESLLTFAQHLEFLLEDHAMPSEHPAAQIGVDYDVKY
jgi:hypothetical protein